MEYRYVRCIICNLIALKLLTDNQGRIQSLERGGCTLLKVEEQKKGHSNNSCPLPNVYTIKYIKILIYSFIVKLHCLMNTVTALLE